MFSFSKLNVSLLNERSVVMDVSLQSLYRVSYCVRRQTGLDHVVSLIEETERM
jgi:hypothetical protein